MGKLSYTHTFVVSLIIVAATYAGAVADDISGDALVGLYGSVLLYVFGIKAYTAIADSAANGNGKPHA